MRRFFSYNSNKRTGKSDVAIKHVATSLSGVYDRVPTKCENFLKRRNFTLQMKNGVIIFYGNKETIVYSLEESKGDRYDAAQNHVTSR